MLIDDYIDYHQKYQKKYGINSIVLMQVGSFFESYAVDNEIESINIDNLNKICDLMNIQISRKNKNNIKNSRSNPLMAGFPIFAIDKFIQILLNHNYTVILIEQVTEPPEPKREVTNIYSPGTSISYCPSEDTSNLLSVYIDTHKNLKTYKDIICVGLSVIDLTTGKSIIYETNSEKDDSNKAYDEIYRFIQTHNPKEIIFNIKECPLENEKLITYLELNNKPYHLINKDEIDKSIFNLSYQKTFLNKLFDLNKTKSAGFLSIHEYLDLERIIYGTISYIALLKFAYEHNERVIDKINKPKIWDSNKYLILTNDSINQLNVIDYASNINNKFSSLYGIVNNASTALGKRLLKERLLNPINDEKILSKRYNYVEELLNKKSIIDDKNNIKEEYYFKIVENYLGKVMDIERLHRRMSLKLLQPADFSNLDIAYNNILKILDLSIFENSQLSSLLPTQKNIDNFREFINEYNSLFDLDEIMKYHLNNISNSFFKKGQIEELDLIKNEITKYYDTYTSISDKLSFYIEKNSSYIKLEFTDKDGYFLQTTKKRGEVMNKSLKNLKNTKINIKIKEYRDFEGNQYPYESNINKNDILDSMIKKTEISEVINFDPKDLEVKFLKDRTKITSNYLNILSYKLRNKQELIKKLTTKYYLEKLEYFYSKYSDSLKSISKFVSEIDFYKSNAKTSIKFNYSRPIIQKEEYSFIDSKDLRHPIIERIQNDIEYVSNDICLGLKNDETLNGMLLYGCNAVGKSSLMKAVGLNIIMAQAGMFVASSQFRYSPFNYIFTRISDNDNIFKGQSSFAVEMSELRSILKRSDKNSIILGDELCSGTESVSAQSIFAAAVIRLAKKDINFIFATHLHELYKMEQIQSLYNVNSFHLKVIFDEKTKKLIYDRKLEKGNGPAIYGLEVCKAMDLDEDFLRLANNIRKKILNIDEEIVSKKKSPYNSDLFVDKCSVCGKDAVDTHHIKEQNTADENDMIGNIHKNNLSNLVTLCKECHINTHNGNLEINGFISTSSGKELDVNIISEEELASKKKSRKKYNDDEIEIIKGYKGNFNMSTSIKLLSQKNEIKISMATLKKIWGGVY